MGERDDGYRRAAARLAEYGFQAGPATRDATRPWEPFAVFASPTEWGAQGWGSVGRSRVWLVEYDSTSTDSEGSSSTETVLLTAVEHPWTTGTAAIAMDWRQWSSTHDAFMTVWDAVTWVPPFIFLKVVKNLAEAANPDRVVGHPEFDRLYYVRADSEEAAARAISPALRDALVRYSFRGSIELRPGWILYAIHRARFDPEGVDRALSFVKPFTEAYPAQGAHPMR